MTNEQLVLRIQAGEDVAGNMAQLWEQNQGYIISMAGRMARQYKAEAEDMAQEAYFGLVRAAQNWNQDGGAAFLGYATWHIRTAMARYALRAGHSCTMPEWRQVRVMKYRRIMAEYARDHGRKPEDRELCDIAGWPYMTGSAPTLDSVRRDSKQLQEAERLDRLAYEDGPTVGETIADRADRIGSAIEREYQRELRADVRAALAELPKDRREVLRLRYEEGLTHKECAARMGIAEGRPRVLEDAALRALRHSRKGRKLADYLSDSGIYSRALHGGADSTARTVLQNLEKEEMLMELAVTGIWSRK